MLNIASIATAKLSEIKQFVRANNIVPTGDLRRRETWEDAAKSFLAAAADLAQETVQGAAQCIREVATYDNAVILANTANVWTRKAFKLVWSLTLVTIALITILIDLYQNREEAKQALVSVYRRQTSRIRDRWVIWHEMGDAAVQVHVVERFQARVIQPALSYRARIRAVARAAVK